MWEKQAKRNQAPDALDAGEPAELERLRRETRDLKMDRELVRKAAAYFAQGTNR